MDTMADPTFLQLTLATRDFDVSLLPLDARQRGTAAFREAVSLYLNAEFERFGGSSAIQIDDEVVEVSWTIDGQPADALTQIVDKLKRREYPGAITLLRLLLSGLPNEAEECLRQATVLDPKDQLAIFGLAEALANLGRLQDVDEAYEKAIAIDASSKIADFAQGERRRIASRQSPL
jgi:tetratricopeptide (TPR) repeat protein